MPSRLSHSWAALICVSGGEFMQLQQSRRKSDFFGRWDTPQHIILDDTAVGPETSEIWPGMLHVDPSSEILVDGR